MGRRLFFYLGWLDGTHFSLTSIRSRNYYFYARGGINSELFGKECPGARKSKSLCLLVCINKEVEELNQVLYKQMNRDIGRAQRLKKCLEKLGGYPERPESFLGELRIFLDALTPNDRSARLLGSQIDAALDDPRWAAMG